MFRNFKFVQFVGIFGNSIMGMGKILEEQDLVCCELCIYNLHNTLNSHMCMYVCYTPVTINRIRLKPDSK